MARRVKAIVRCIRLGKWFPPDDPIATAVARLSILREDYLLAVLATTPDEMPFLDGNGQLWRQFYFVRNIMTTLMEAKNAMMKLEQSREFQTALGKAGAGFRKEVKSFLRIVHSSDLQEIRNNIGGHVNFTAVANTLRHLDGGFEEGVLDLAPTLEKTHFKFTTQLMARMLTIHKVGQEDIKVTMHRFVELLTNAKLLEAFDRIIYAYCQSRGLV